MKYFINANERVASGHENYIEFQPPDATEDFWDKTSLYMHEITMAETGFGAFWCNCMYEDIVFDMASFKKDELIQMVDKAAKCGVTIIEVISELKEWADSQLAEIVTVNWASDRALARRIAQREAYSVEPRFYEEVRAMHKCYKDVPFVERVAKKQEAYEELLRKYNMPNCFFPFPLYEPDKWD